MCFTVISFYSYLHISKTICTIEIIHLVLNYNKFSVSCTCIQKLIDLFRLPFLQTALDPKLYTSIWYPQLVTPFSIEPLCKVPLLLLDIKP